MRWFGARMLVPGFQTHSDERRQLAWSIHWGPVVGGGHLACDVCEPWLARFEHEAGAPEQQRLAPGAGQKCICQTRGYPRTGAPVVHRPQRMATPGPDCSPSCAPGPASMRGGGGLAMRCVPHMVPPG